MQHVTNASVISLVENMAKKNRSHFSLGHGMQFSDYIPGWSKEPQCENDCGSFLPCFLLVYEHVTQHI